jgi:hypothetical protein
VIVKKKDMMYIASERIMTMNRGCWFSALLTLVIAVLKILCEISKIMAIELTKHNTNSTTYGIVENSGIQAKKM